jgi:hypothetical protein
MDILLQVFFVNVLALVCKAFVVANANGISTMLFMDFLLSAHLLFSLEAKVSQD